MSAPLVTEIAIIGAGTAGIRAFAELNRLGISTLLIDRGPLGTTCARVGCMPSKAALHAAHQWSNLRALLNPSDLSKSAVTPNQLWQQARDMRDQLAGSTAERTRSAAGERLIMGQARFTGPNTLDVDGQEVRAEAFIVATGSRPIVPGFLAPLEDRLLTTDTLFDMEQLPESIGLLGLGAVGLEMGLALTRLGVRVVSGDMKPLPAGISDPEIGARAVKHFSGELSMWLGEAVSASRNADGVQLQSGSNTAQVDRVLAALGRQPNVDGMALDMSGAELNDRGQPLIDEQTLRVTGTQVFLAGDVSALRPLMHEAADEGIIAARSAANLIKPRNLDLPTRRVTLGIVFSDPDIASVGLSYDQLDLDATAIGTAEGSSNGRSKVMGADSNLVRLYVEKSTGKLLGASLIATRGEHLAHLLAWSIQREETVKQLLGLPYYHPSIEEMLQSALQDAARQLGDRS